jgi:site-specific recombinase XerC
MSAKQQLQRSIFYLLKHNKHGSYETQGARKKILMQAAAELTAGTFKLKHIGGLKQKHVVYLNEVWKKKGLSVATMKNRNAHLRWACEVLGKMDVVPSNGTLGIGRRRYSGNNINKAVDLDKIDLSRITNRNVLVQIHLQRYLGLRREET